MKKHFVLGALAVLALAACTKSEVVELNKGNEISLTAVTGKNLTKAQDGFCNNKLPGDFQVWASTSTTDPKKVYFQNETYSLSSGTTYTSATAHYWPEDKLDFFAAKNHNGTVTFNPTAAAPFTVAGYTVDSDVSKQTDFIYAVNKGQAKTSGSAPLNFRHALSQIEFQAKNSNPNIYVKISGVTIKRVYSVGNFSVTDATTNNYDIHNPGAVTRSGRCTWADQGTFADYEISFDPVALGSAATSLSVTDDSGKEYNSNTMYLIPQTVPELWAGPGAATTNKAYFEINAEIWNVAGASFNPSTDIKLHTGAIAVPIPASTEWEDGLRYVYTFNFTTTGTGGGTPGTGDPVLTPITLSVTVDDFVDAGETEVNVE